MPFENRLKKHKRNNADILNKSLQGRLPGDPRDPYLQSKRRWKLHGRSKLYVGDGIVTKLKFLVKLVKFLIK